MRNAFPAQIALTLINSVIIAPLVFAQNGKQSSGNWQDVVLLAHERPLKLRLSIHIDGRPFRKSWDRHQRELFSYLDANRDGKLTGQELLRAPHHRQLLQQLRGQEIEPAPPPEFAAVLGSKAKKAVTVQQFETYYQQKGVGPLFQAFGKNPPSANPLDARLFELLDKNRDGKLSKNEVVPGERLLGKLDKEDDENVSVREILGRQGASRVAFEPGHERAGDSRILLLPRRPQIPPQSLIRFLTKKYDRNGDALLTQSELGVPNSAFKHFDANGNGNWSEKELVKWLSDSVAVEIAVWIGKTPGSKKSDKHANPVVLANKSSVAHYRGRSTAVLMDMGKEQIKLFAGNVQRRAKSMLARRYQARFRARDNGDGFLDTKEIYKPPFEWTALLRLADGNGDDRLSRQEVKDYADLVEKGTSSFALLTVADRSPSLFETIDADHDARLGLRDLKMMWQQLVHWDRNRDGLVAREEIPRQIHVIVSYGPPPSADRTTPSPPGYGPAKRPTRIPGAPPWFAFMDVNSDGDVSPREFLGARKDFRRIDLDGDGLIDPTEAKALPSKKSNK